MSEQLKPELRFPEFDGNWNETTFDSHYSFKPTNSFSRDKLNYEAGTVKNIHYGDIHTEFDLLFDVTKEKVPFINDDVNIDNIDDENYVQKGDLVIADASEDYADIGKAIEVININNESLLAGLHTFLARREDDEVAEGFFAFLLNTYKARYEIMRIAQGTKVLGLSKNRLGEIPLYIPEPDEQQRIANFLKAIDKRIKLLKVKKEALEDYKTSIMQKLFAQEIRFKQDDGSNFSEWDNEQLSEVAEIITGKTPPTKDKELWGGDILFITPTDIDDKVKYQFSTSRTVVNAGNLKLLPKDSIVYTCIASIGKIAITTKPSITNQQINSLITKEEMDSEFVYYALKQITPWIKSLQATTTLPIINKTEFSKFMIPKPELTEQKKIGFLLKSIDSKIENLQSKTLTVEVFKKSIMQKMFV